MKYPISSSAAVALMAALCLTRHAAGVEPKRIDGALLSATAQQALRQAAPSNVRVECRPRLQPDAITVPGGALSLHAQPDLQAWSPSMRVVVSVNVDGQTVRRVPVWFSVQAWAQAPVAAHDLTAGQRLSDLDLRLAEVDLAALHLDRPADLGALRDQRLKRAVAQGRPVSPRDAETVPEVVRGQRVIVEYDGPGITIAAPGVAMADARLGHQVRVRMPRNEELTATVIDPQRARITDKEAHP